MLRYSLSMVYVLGFGTAHKIGWILGVFAKSVDKLTVVGH